MNDHLGVAVRLEAVSLRLQCGAQGTVVIDLSIEDHADAAVLVEDRLLPAMEVDDGQAPHRQAHGAVEVMSGAVRTATLDAVIHAKQRALGEARAGRKKSTDSTHKGAIPGSASLPPCAAPAKPARERRFADHTGNGGPADA